jgi:membrane-bound lytic murein transglycosylase D
VTIASAERLLDPPSPLEEPAWALVGDSEPAPPPLLAAPAPEPSAPDDDIEIELQGGAEVEAAEDESLPEVTAALESDPAAQAEPLRSDPADYEVHEDGRVTVQAAETLGHYAEWLEVSASALRARNGMRGKQPIVIGRRVKLDFSRVTPEEFERRRLEYHRTLQSEFFDHFVVTGTEQHVLRKGETLWYLAARKYRVPVWLLRQYNPDLDFGSLQAGAAMVVPQIEPRSQTEEPNAG